MATKATTADLNTSTAKTTEVKEAPAKTTAEEVAVNKEANKKETAVQFQFAIADAKWHRGETPSPGGNLPSDRYLTRHFYSCNVRVRMLCSLN